jgi:oligoribonuclease NrnB/cAMP/cGMP phosphodiesterase (DHH superfamily)
MDDDLIDSATLSLSRRSVLPGAGFFYPDSLDEQRAEERTRETVEGADTVVVGDGDADGMGCVALIREARDAALDVSAFEAAIAERLGGHEAGADADEGEADGTADADAAGDDDGVDAEDEEADDADEPRSSVAYVGAGPHSLGDALERVGEYIDEGADVFVCDLCPDEYDSVGEHLETVVERGGAVRWFDHHQWDDAVADAVRDAGVDLVVGDSEEECTTDVTLRSLDHDFDARFAELAEVTRDHDLWIKEDPRSDDLADYAYWTDAEEYIAVVGAYGADLPEEVEAYLAHRREEKEALIGKAVERAEMQEVGPWTVGVTYGRCSQNEVAEALREQGADAAVIVKPAGSASIRGTEHFERAHEVARQVNGGGHPKAAGCKPDIYDDMLDYANHWVSRGEACKRVILAGFERVAERAEAEAEADEDDEGTETER